jgi:hypothetical protein
MFSSFIDALAHLRNFFSPEEKLDDDVDDDVKAAIRNLQAYYLETGVALSPDALEAFMDEERDDDDCDDGCWCGEPHCDHDCDC